MFLKRYNNNSVIIYMFIIHNFLNPIQTKIENHHIPLTDNSSIIFSYHVTIYSCLHIKPITGVGN